MTSIAADSTKRKIATSTTTIGPATAKAHSGSVIGNSILSSFHNQGSQTTCKSTSLSLDGDVNRFRAKYIGHRFVRQGSVNRPKDCERIRRWIIPLSAP